MTDLYHGYHYDVTKLACSTSSAIIHGEHVDALSTELKDSEDLGCFPKSRKVPVKARFETPAIDREIMRSWLVFTKKKSKNLRNRNSENETNLSNKSIRQPMQLYAVSLLN